MAMYNLDSFKNEVLKTILRNKHYKYKKKSLFRVWMEYNIIFLSSILNSDFKRNNKSQYLKNSSKQSFT